MTYFWEEYNDDSLLKLRFSELGLTLENARWGDFVKKLYDELEARGLKFRPKIYFGDEWFSPQGVPAISIPFYLAHPRLEQLERKNFYEVEGSKPEEFLKLLRHEAGHCFDSAYRFSRRASWRKIFGNPQKDYEPETYRPKPYSRSYVRHIDRWYAQAHPDEDFAESFAVWLNPDSNWREKYKDWPLALQKLNLIESFANEVREKEPRVKSGKLICNVARMKTTLGKHYIKRKREHADEYPDFYDSDLRKIFAEGESKKLGLKNTAIEVPAKRFMMKERKSIVESVSRWTGERKFTIDELVKRLANRCGEIDLVLKDSLDATKVQTVAYLSTLVTHYLFTGKFKRTV